MRTFIAKSNAGIKIETYIDDDSIHRLLVRLLREEHDVQLPTEVGLAESSDPLHLTHAIRDARALLSHNHKDFSELHQLIQAAQGHHAGILLVRRDNDPRRDMTPRGIVSAVRKLEQSGVTLADEVHILNHWR